MEVVENFTSQWIWNNYEGWLLGMIQNSFEENQLFIDDLYSELLKRCYIDRINYGKVICRPFLQILLNIKEYRIGIGVGLIIVGAVEDSGGVCEEVALDKVALIMFPICDIVEDGNSLCRLLLYVDIHSLW